jgi:hypothetical protein
MKEEKEAVEGRKEGWKEGNGRKWKDGRRKWNETSPEKGVKGGGSEESEGHKGREGITANMGRDI